MRKRAWKKDTKWNGENGGQGCCLGLKNCPFTGSVENCSTDKYLSNIFYCNQQDCLILKGYCSMEERTSNPPPSIANGFCMPQPTVADNAERLTRNPPVAKPCSREKGEASACSRRGLHRVWQTEMGPLRPCHSAQRGPHSLQT